MVLVVPQKRSPDYLMIVRIFLLNGIFMYYVYIIYSLTIDRYYIGQTDNIEERMEQHKSGFFLHSYTSKTKDWKIVLSINCSSRKQSVNIESYIKSMKSRRFISDIIQNQHRVNEIIDRFKDWKSLCPRPEASGRFLVVPLLKKLIIKQSDY